MLDILPFERYGELESVFSEAGCGLPGESDTILFRESNGKIESFIVIENLLRVGQIYNESDDRSAPLQMIREVLKRVPKDSSVIVIATDERYESLCEKLEMREIEGKLFRRDF